MEPVPAGELKKDFSVSVTRSEADLNHPLLLWCLNSDYKVCVCVIIGLIFTEHLPCVSNCVKHVNLFVL